jgi:hypothetical protein
MAVVERAVSMKIPRAGQRKEHSEKQKECWGAVVFSDLARVYTSNSG